MKIVPQARLKPLNTLALPARCDRLIEVENRQDFNHLANLVRGDSHLCILGEGSNTVFVDKALPHTVIRIKAPARLSQAIVADGDLFLVDAGVSWRHLVQWSVSHGLGGIENLAAIPGTCGAAPVQNIGAYGVELKDVLEWVEIFDWQKNGFDTLSNKDCQFAYRNSLFKREPHHPWIITRIALRLRPDSPLKLDYTGVRETLRAQGIRPEKASYAQVAGAITAIRAAKLPDPRNLPNAGSFFKNPVINRPQLQKLLEKWPNLPHWKQTNEQHKVSAAWIIEQLGLNQERVGEAGFYPDHALILVNYGQASGADVTGLANKVMAAVAAACGIELEPEPVHIRAG